MQIEEVGKILEPWIEQKFDTLYRDLCGLHPHPFEWMHLMHRPRWWQFRKHRAHLEVCAVFAQHGIWLRDEQADHFLKVCRNHPQRFDEDAGGAVVRQLRATFGYAFLGPYMIWMETPDAD